MKIAHVVAEYAGLAQTGGLADAVAALTREMAGRGHDVRIVMPRYADLNESSLADEPVRAADGCVAVFGDAEYSYSLHTSRAPESEAVLCLVDCPELYDRAGIYTAAADEHHRFALLARAALEGCQRFSWSPDVVHCHDWHAGLLPWLLRSAYAWDPLLASVKSVLTVHNLAYQGVFGPDTAAELGEPETPLPLHPPTGEQRLVNFLAAGLRWADAVTTVSPTYAREILTPEQGMGLDGVLRERSRPPIGILNGVDYDRWDPKDDPLIPQQYSADAIEGKAVCRRELLAEHRLEADPSGPILGIVSRLAHQKGLELVLAVLPELLATRDIRLVVLGTGESEYERRFVELEEGFPEKVAFSCTFDLGLAHRIEAGSDLFLMPSRFEPCGLNQMYSLRYGTLPLVHRTGGLADTVTPHDDPAGSGTGFVFTPFGEAEFRGALLTALAVFANEELWRDLLVRGMSQDFSWSRQVEAYLETYRSLAS